MRRLFASLLIAALAFPVHAEDVDPDSLRLARLVVESSGLARSFHGLTEAMRQDMSRVATTRPDLATDLNAALADIQPDFDAQADAMTAKAAALYAQKLSRRELADCAVFFAGASGKAYVAAQPALMGDLGAAVTDWRRAASVTLMTRLREKLRAKGKDF
ncbi:hypothetical protein CCR94_23270 [Rhodoblastus sphagnicola]|uniref:DUF2059 domain-containing protein n=1 Tax=Rhodoblastus sphagnicola TaxID=333368 RepID=A0A2S6MUC0_9HYPH|nr:DUF2059 domain-containing protein [Rhodoblastus sphagnicola]MBB4197043.1 hypothetical protein [Rhodoblastus sphagnicola]PPQ25957.1 hypothetical protein CCR94_23270 [Rhodoblastus sphagnicola]